MSPGERSVTISGIGIVGPTGVGVEAFWNGIVAGPSRVRSISRFDTSTFWSRIAAEVTDDAYRDLVPLSRLRNASRVSQFALAASRLALQDAQLDPSHYSPAGLGVVFGTSLGGWFEAQQQTAILIEKGAARVNPFALNSAANHAAAMEVATFARAEGTHATFSTGCCASMHAVGHAARLVAEGEIECCLAGGTEAPVSPLVLAAMGRTRELSGENDAPQRASCPFDRRHNGIVLGEGSVVFVIESAQHARSRGVAPYAAILSQTSSIDATDIFQVDQSGAAGARALAACLTRGAIDPSELDYVAAHGNSSAHFDRKETVVLKRALGEFAARIPASSIKAIVGHAFGASAAFQIAATCLAMRHGLIPPTHNLHDPDPECDLDFVPGEPRECAIRHALVCSYGFGGLNAFMALRAPN